MAQNEFLFVSPIIIIIIIIIIIDILITIYHLNCKNNLKKLCKNLVA